MNGGSVCQQPHLMFPAPSQRILAAFPVKSGSASYLVSGHRERVYFAICVVYKL